MPIESENRNLFARFSKVFKRCPNMECVLLVGDSNWTYNDLERRSPRYSGYLKTQGVNQGDRVVVQVEKTAEALAFYLACLQSGIVYVPVNTASTLDEIRYFVDDAEPNLVVLINQDACARIRSMFPITVISDDELAEHAKEAPLEEHVAALGTDDLAAILYTSGTTGRPKGAMLTHGNLLSNAETLLAAWGWRDDDVLLHALPIYHVHGLFVAIHCVLLSGTAMWFLPSFNLDQVIERLPESTVMMGVPTYYIRLLKHEGFNRDVVSNMRLFISGSAPLSEQTFHQFHDRTGHRILERYGMSETIMNTSNPLEGERVAGTVGFALPDIEIQITNAGGEVLPVETVGQIEVRGPNVFKGYWNKPEKTAEEFTNEGFFKTGDMAFKDREGRISIVGREKDLVISGGLNVYPAEVETLIDEIEGVEETAVIGVPHPDFGEGVVAVIKSNEPVSLEQVRNHLREKLAAYKHPKAIVRVEDLPKNAMGKIQKNVLREQNSALFDST